MPGARLYRLTYYSRNAIADVHADTVREVGRILAAARRRNACDDVTGALLRSEGHFAQVLEGPRDAVERTFERVQRDWRHADLVVLGREPVGARLFGGHPLAYVWQPEIEAWEAQGCPRLFGVAP